MDFVCDFGVSSTQTEKIKFGELTHFRDMANTATQQSTFMLLLLLIFRLTTCKLTLSHFDLQFH